MELGRLKLGAIDQDPGAMLSPSVAHDLELQANRRQLSRRRVANFYCEFFSQVAPYILWQNTCGTSRVLYGPWANVYWRPCLAYGPQPLPGD